MHPDCLDYGMWLSLNQKRSSVLPFFAVKLDCWNAGEDWQIVGLTEIQRTN
jgi:hypothetical protein